TDKRRGLGRGLGALIPNTSGDETGNSLPTRPVDLFFPEPKGRKTASESANAARKPAAAAPVQLVEVPGATFMELPVGQIHPNRKQPRTVFDEEDMAELVHSVREIGVLQPIVVRKSTEKGDQPYELVMGERRWRASQA